MRRRPHGQAGGFENGLQFAGADYGVHFRDALHDLVAIALHQQPATMSFFADPAVLWRAISRIVSTDSACSINEAAGIHNEDLGLFGM